MVARERWEAKRLEVMESDRKLTEFFPGKHKFPTKCKATAVYINSL